MNKIIEGLPEQEFNGKIYYLYEGERYFSKGCTRLHRAVWEFYNGEIPEGYEIHHKDEDTSNNDISNLEMVLGTEHNSYHAKKRHADNPEYSKRFHDLGIEAAKEWHKSEAGLEWHRQNAIKCNFGHLTFGTRNCQVCGKEFTAKTNSQIFCGNSCKSKYRRMHGLDDVTKNCLWCGNAFITNKYNKSDCCSRACGKKLSMQLNPPKRVNGIFA